MRILARSTVLAMGVVCSVALVGCGQRLDENLCPIGEAPRRTTVLLLDTSDALSPEHEAVRDRLLRELYSLDSPGRTSDLYVGDGGRLVVYELAEDIRGLTAVEELCAPGQHPSAWPWWRGLIEGRAIMLSRWRLARERIEALFDEEPPLPLSSSPIIEAIGAIMPRHVRSELSADGESEQVHLILFSDLLQNSDSLSHYGPYLDADAIKTTTGTRHLATNLAGVEVSIYRLERARDARWQTVDHYYWWTMLIQDFGGQVIYQESI